MADQYLPQHPIQRKSHYEAIVTLGEKVAAEHSLHELETNPSQHRYLDYKQLRRQQPVHVRMMTIVIFDVNWRYFRVVCQRLSDCVMTIDDYRLCRKLFHVTVCRKLG